MGAREANTASEFSPEALERALKRQDFVLGVLSTAKGEPWTPVQVQKIFFLIDKRLGKLVGGPWFDFVAYDYGPFDRQVYLDIESLASRGSVQILGRDSFSASKYRVTREGRKEGNQALAGLREDVRHNIHDLSDWVRSLSFRQLVSAIYKAYPEMRARSVFRE